MSTMFDSEILADMRGFLLFVSWIFQNLAERFHWPKNISLLVGLFELHSFVCRQFLPAKKFCSQSRQPRTCTVQLMSRHWCQPATSLSLLTNTALSDMERLLTNGEWDIERALTMEMGHRIGVHKWKMGHRVGTCKWKMGKFSRLELSNWKLDIEP